jgi:Tfp pilus assembly protein FimV
MSSIPASLSHPLTTMATMATQRTHLDPVRPSSPRPVPRPAGHPTSADRAVTPRFVAQRGPRFRRRRAVAVAFVGLVLAAVLALVFVGGRASADGSAPGEIRPAAVYIVRPGDTLWDIAVALAPGKDPRVVVSALERSAGGASLVAGQHIVLPASLQR